MGYNKWILAGLGLAFYGFIGALVGYIIGTILDNVIYANSSSGPDTAQPRPSPNAGGDLTMTLVLLSAAMMKADGKVTHRELDHVRRFFMAQFGPVMAGELLILLRDVLKRDIDSQEVCQRVRETMPYPVRLQLLHYLIALAYADGSVDRAEFNLLKRMAHDMGITDQDLGSLSAMFRTGDPNAAYEVLEIPPTATDDEVKKAYRRMAMKYHPDKVAQLGEEVQKAATEKFKKVQEAYETIQKKRGMK
jgi:DnaJ like chaperone protein